MALLQIAVQIRLGSVEWDEHDFEFQARRFCLVVEEFEHGREVAARRAPMGREVDGHQLALQILGFSRF